MCGALCDLHMAFKGPKSVRGVRVKDCTWVNPMPGCYLRFSKIAPPLGPLVRIQPFSGCHGLAEKSQFLGDLR